MSNVLGRTASRDESRTLPKGEAIGRYSSYLDAQKAVDYLADSKFPVQQVSIIGNDLKTVERVTGRLSYPRVALASAATGAWFGLFVGFILTLFGGDSTYLPILSSMALGAVFWVLFGVIAYAFQRGKRDFTSTSQVIATSYDIIVDPSVAGEARRLLQQLPMNPQANSNAASGQYWGAQPPQQGQPPQRPESWGPPPGQNLQSDRPAPEAAEGAPTEQQPARSSSPARGQFPDLPDGRPQYGVRINPKTEEDRARSAESGESSRSS
ncbi:ECF transporter S component [Arthrobacter sp. JZ12]|uniref:general stress protein n=1 Tax=Arthrobacter sp. JZ12 TaxID=2654190 RepID=UPI002B473732|nr:general stress protein [Arthrobacter sp. JZ12]WRH25471.1 ECF transporter S component [Arthrobacter sp. JZ12]